METERARQILKSNETIYVAYQNIPIWIEELKNNDIAAIRDLNSDVKMEVPVRELQEMNV